MRKSKQLIKIFVLALVFSVTGVIFAHSGKVYAVPWAGSGTPDDPYQITDCGKLQTMSGNLTASYVLANDIDCAESVDWNDGDGFLPIGGTDFLLSAFSGTLDGQGNSISHLYINAPDGTTAGLFGSTYGAHISNLNLNESYISGPIFTGGIVGIEVLGSVITKVSLTNVLVLGTSNDSLGGPFAGVGGIAGMILGDATISQSSVTGAIATDIGGDGDFNLAGGIVGMMLDGGTVEDSYSSALIQSLDSTQIVAGGAIGALFMLGEFTDSTPTVTNVYSTGEIHVSGSNIAGGLVGAIEGGVISHSFAAGLISVEDPIGPPAIGGILGVYIGGTLTDDYADATRTGTDTCVASVGDYEGCNLINTDVEPDSDYFFGNHSKPPLNNWDFDSVWTIQTGDYPILDPRDAPPEDPGDDGDSDSGGHESGSGTTSTSSTLKKYKTILANSTSSIDDFFSGPARITLNDYKDFVYGEEYQLYNLVKGQAIHVKIKINGKTENHTITIKKIGKGYVILTIASTPFDVRVNLGATKTIVIEGQDALKIQLNNIHANMADLSFSRVLSDSKNAPDFNQQAASSVPGPAVTSAEPSDTGLKAISAAVVLVVFAVIAKRYLARKSSAK